MLKEPSGTGCDELKLKCSQVRQSGCANFVVGVGGALELILDTAEGWMLPRRFVSRARRQAFADRAAAHHKSNSMSKLDISTATAEAIVLMEDLRERLAGHDVSVIGAALGEMVAAYIASFSPEMRDETRTILLAFVDEMVPFVVADMISKGQAPAYWMKTDL